MHSIIYGDIIMNNINVKQQYIFHPKNVFCTLLYPDILHMISDDFTPTTTTCICVYVSS